MDKTGCLQVYTGSGKGKSTSALGLTFRAIGRNWNVLFVQFLKGDKATDRSYGELISAKKFSNNLKFIQSHNQYKVVLEYNKTDEDKRLVQSAWDKMLCHLNKKKYDLLVLDEILPTIGLRLITQRQFFKFIQDIRKERPDLELVVTGRIWDDTLFDKIKNISDYFTDMRAVKHPFNKHCPNCKRSFEYRSNYCPNCGNILITKSAREGIEF